MVLTLIYLFIWNPRPPTPPFFVTNSDTLIELHLSDNQSTSFKAKTDTGCGGCVWLRVPTFAYLVLFTPVRLAFASSPFCFPSPPPHIAVEELPDEIERLEQLEVFFITNNKLKVLPAGVGAMTKSPSPCCCCGLTGVGWCGLLLLLFGRKGGKGERGGGFTCFAGGGVSFFPFVRSQQQPMCSHALTRASD